MTTITTRAILDGEAERTGLTRTQLLRIAAKSALIRHLASDRDGREFVLKGGTLLHHVYGSPRLSVVDADFTHRSPLSVDKQLLSETMTTSEDGFKIEFAPDDWTQDQGIYVARAVAYEINDGTLDGRRGMTVTVSVRLGEWLDPQAPVTYRDPLLASNSVFEVLGLTREELAAEKILAWCTKPLLVKHAIDLACLARDHATCDTEKVVRWTRRKLEIEGHMERYSARGIRTFDDLGRVLLDELARGQLARWDPTDLLFPPVEMSRPETETLTRSGNIVRLLEEFWLPVLRAARS